MDTARLKTDLRKRMAALRDAIPAAERVRLSEAIRGRLYGLPVFAGARRVHLYASFRSEFDTFPILHRLWAAGVETVLPLILKAERRTAQKLVRSLADLAPGWKGILEPKADLPEIDPATLDVVVVPGLAFDRMGGRMGYGGGYYDRFLAECPGVRIAAVFGAQIIDRVPTEPHDLPVHLLVTEAEIHDCRSEAALTPRPSPASGRRE